MGLVYPAKEIDNEVIKAGFKQVNDMMAIQEMTKNRPVHSLVIL